MPNEQINKDIHNLEDSNLQTDRFLIDHSYEPNVDPNTNSAFFGLKLSKKQNSLIETLPMPT
jgi:hypothetical protein